MFGERANIQTFCKDPRIILFNLMAFQVFLDECKNVSVLLYFLGTIDNDKGRKGFKFFLLVLIIVKMEIIYAI
jgi:hypothetical protein